METTANFTSEIILLQEYTANPSSANKYARLNTSLGGKYWSNHRPAPPLRSSFPSHAVNTK